MNQMRDMFQPNAAGQPTHEVTDILSEGRLFTLADIDGLRELASEEEAQSDTDAAHVRRVGKLSFHLALLAGLNLNAARALQHAAALHDIGKHSVPAHILNKPGALTPSERVAIESHAAAGGRLLAGKGAAAELAAEVAHYHHEWWNGLGYPAGLFGRQTPLSARIVAIADVFDALVSVRCYKQSWAVTAALDYIEARAGTQFDPRLARLFVDFVRAQRLHWEEMQIPADAEALA